MGRRDLAGTLVVLLIFAGCNTKPLTTPDVVVSEEDTVMMESAGFDRALEVFPALCIMLEDGTVIPGAIGAESPEIARTTEQETVYLHFLDSAPDSVTAELTPVYSGGTHYAHDPEKAPLYQEDASHYQLFLPYWFEYSPLMLYYFQYRITANYGEQSYDYNMTLQLDGLPRAASIPVVNGVPQEMPEITIAYEMGRGVLQQYRSEKRQWNGELFERESLLQREDFYSGVMMTETQQVVVDFAPYPPNEIAVAEHIFLLDDDKNPYWESAGSVAYTQVVAGVYEFTAVWPGKDVVGLLGYSITASWGENICEYVFLFNPRLTPESME